VSKSVSKEWTFGNLQLIEDLVGNKINAFKNNIQDRLLPAVQEGDEEELKKSYGIINHIMLFLIDDLSVNL